MCCCDCCWQNGRSIAFEIVTIVLGVLFWSRFLVTPGLVLFSIICQVLLVVSASLGISALKRPDRNLGIATAVMSFVTLAAFVAFAVYVAFVVLRHTDMGALKSPELTILEVLISIYFIWAMASSLTLAIRHTLIVKRHGDVYPRKQTEQITSVISQVHCRPQEVCLF